MHSNLYLFLFLCSPVLDSRSHTFTHSPTYSLSQTCSISHYFPITNTYLFFIENTSYPSIPPCLSLFLSPSLPLVSLNIFHFLDTYSCTLPHSSAHSLIHLLTLSSLFLHEHIPSLPPFPLLTLPTSLSLSYTHPHTHTQVSRCEA